MAVQATFLMFIFTQHYFGFNFEIRAMCYGAPLLHIVVNLHGLDLYIEIVK